MFKKLVILPQLWPIFAELDTEADKKYLYDNSGLVNPTSNFTFSFYNKIKTTLSLRTPCCQTPYEPQETPQYLCLNCQKRPFCVICHMLDGQHQSDCNHEPSHWKKFHSKIFEVLAELNTELDKQYLDDNSDNSDNSDYSDNSGQNFFGIKFAEIRF
jgi:hypothetical protein